MRRSKRTRGQSTAFRLCRPLFHVSSIHALLLPISAGLDLVSLLLSASLRGATHFMLQGSSLPLVFHGRKSSRCQQARSVET